MGGGIITEPYTIEDRAGHTSCVNSLSICPARFFKCMGKVWLAKCNLYNFDYQRVKERFARAKYKNLLSQNRQNPSDCGDKRFKCFLAPEKESKA